MAIAQAAHSAPAPSAGTSEFKPVDSANLRVGTKLRVPIYDSQDVLLLAKGAVINSSFMQKLKIRGVETVKVHQSELARVYACQPLGTAQTVPQDRGGFVCPLENPGTLELDAEIRRGGFLGLPTQGEAFAKELTSRGNKPYDPEMLDDFVESSTQSISQLDDVYHTLSRGQGLNIDALSHVADEALTDLTRDADLFACFGINPYSDKYPVRHSFHTSMLAMSIGVKLGLDRATLKELSVGCLIHDAGMLQIDQDVLNRPKVLDAVSFLEITKHPVVVFDMMKSMTQFSSRSAFVAYQIHERCDGSGYPRRRESGQIHFLSKLAAVADAFIGLVSPRPHRPGMLPYRALEKIIRGVQEGLYDPLAVRALLRTVSLFPIGSFVQLSDGRAGKVIRANADAYNQPIIEAWRPGQMHLAPEVINLFDVPNITVTKPLVKLPSRPSIGVDDQWE